MPTLQQPEAYVGQAATLFGPNGTMVNESTEKFFRSFVDAFATLIERAVG